MFISNWGKWKLKPQRYYLVLICKIKKVWQYTVHGWFCGGNRESDGSTPWAGNSLVFQPWQPPKVRNVLYKGTHYKHVKLKQKANKTIITVPTCSALFYFLFILLHNCLNCFHYPLMHCKPQSKKHSFEKHPLVNKETCARLIYGSFLWV